MIGLIMRDSMVYSINSLLVYWHQNEKYAVVILGVLYPVSQYGDEELHVQRLSFYSLDLADDI